MPFRKVENCNQVIQIGKQLKFSLVNVAGNDFVQGNKKLILGNVLNLSSTYNMSLEFIVIHVYSSLVFYYIFVDWFHPVSTS